MNLSWRSRRSWTRGLGPQAVRTWISLAGLLVAAGSAAAGDWPQILGPHRNGLADDEQLLASWPVGGPQTVWQRDVGRGFAGAAIWKDRLVLFHRVGNELVGEGLDAATGKPRWKVTFPTKYASTISSDDGPRCVPLVHEGLVFLLGPEGELQCVELGTGKKVWFRNLYQEFKAPTDTSAPAAARSSTRAN